MNDGCRLCQPGHELTGITPGQEQAVGKLVKSPSEAENTFLLLLVPLQKVCCCLCSRQTCPKIPRFDLAIEFRHHQTQSLHPPLNSWSKFMKWQLCCVCGCPAHFTSSCSQQFFLYLLILYTSVPPPVW